MYFQVHLIHVLIDKPLKQILLNHECTSRMSKWMIELTEHEITFGSRHLIKGHIMADFLAEVYTPPPTIPGKNSKAQPIATGHDDEIWTLYTDRVSC